MKVLGIDIGGSGRIFGGGGNGGNVNNGNFVPPPPMEPAAANDGFGAFSSF